MINRAPVPKSVSASQTLAAAAAIHATREVRELLDEQAVLVLPRVVDVRDLPRIRRHVVELPEDDRAEAEVATPLREEQVRGGLERASAPHLGSRIWG